MTEEIFPYEKFRRGQLEAIRFIKSVFEEEAIGFLHAPTGIGKTISALTAYLSMVGSESLTKLVILTRTKNQAYMYVKELERIRKKGVVIPDYVVFRSKKDMCLLARRSERLRKAPYHIFLKACELLKRQNRCPYYKRSYDLGVPTKHLVFAAEEVSSRGASYRNIMHFAESERVCPYEVARYLATQAQIIIGSYSYIFKPDIREKFLSTIGEGLSTIYLLIDEAHNLPDFIRDAMSLSLSTLTIEQATRELERIDYEYSDYLIDSLLALKETIEEIAGDTLLIGDSGPKIVDVTGIIKILSKRDIDLIKEAGEKYISVSEDFSSRLIWLSEVLDYLRILYSMEEFVTTIEQKETESSKRYYVLTIQLLDPSYEAADIFQDVKAAVLMSGSLYPLDYYETILGLKMSQKLRNRIRELILPSPFPEDAFSILVDKICTTKYTKRSEEMFNLIARRIEAINTAAPRGKAILIVFPSYELLKIIRLRTEIRDREVIIETQNTEIEHVLRRLKDNSDTIIYSVAGGKLMEGIDYRLENRTILSTVVLVGLPFPEWNDVTKAQESYFSKKFGEKMGRFLAITIPAIRKSLQAGGRLIRDETDRGLVIILDKRYWEYGYWKYFPQNWRRYQTFVTNNELIKLIEIFFRIHR